MHNSKQACCCFTLSIPSSPTFTRRNHGLTARRSRSTSTQRSTPRMEWKPAGLFREAVELKAIEVKMLENLLLERPDHPINMKRAFFAQKTCHDVSKSIRRRDGTLSMLSFVKRFQPPEFKPGRIFDDDDMKSQLIHPLHELPLDVRSLWACGLDSAIISTDTLKHGIEISEFRKVHRELAACGTPLPLIRHDVFIDPVQIAEAVEAGAKAINIIAGAALPELPELLNAATMMGIESIVECHTKLEVDFAMECGATILFLNDWDRSRNMLIQGNAKKLIEQIPPFVLTLGGGGISSVNECWDFLDYGFNGVVLGTTILKSNRPKAFIDETRTYNRFTGDVFSGDQGVPFSENTNV